MWHLRYSRVYTKNVTLQERAKAESINRKLRSSLADYKVPHVMEYVSEKADLYELQKKVKSWERKVEIAEVSTCLSRLEDFFLC